VKAKVDGRGVANILVQVLIALFVVPIVYVIGGFVLRKVLDSVPTSHLSSEASAILAYLDAVWNYWPIIAIVIVIVWAIAAAQRREPWYEEE